MTDLKHVVEIKPACNQTIEGMLVDARKCHSLLPGWDEEHYKAAVDFVSIFPGDFKFKPPFMDCLDVRLDQGRRLYRSWFNQMWILKIKNELVLLSPREFNLIFGNVTPSKEGVS